MNTDSDAHKDLTEQLREHIDNLSAFQLYQLRHEIDLILSDPDRTRSVRNQIREGDVIEYFDPEKNRCVSAEVEACHRTRLSVKNLDDGESWRIEYVAVNVHGDRLRHSEKSAQRLTRAQLAVGDVVGFTDKQNRDHIGQVVKLNPKTARLLAEDGTQWRVAYSLLFSILDADGRVTTDVQQRLTFEPPGD